MVFTEKTEAEIREAEKFAKKLREFMSSERFTERLLSEVTGVSRRTIQMLKKGGTLPKTITRRRIEVIMEKHKANKRTKDFL